MNRSLLKKSMLEGRLLLTSCALAMYAFCWARVWLVSQFEMSRFQTVVEQFREFERFAPVPFEQLFTYAGRIALTYDEPIVIVCVSLWAIARGSDCVSGEVGRGTMEMLLAQPLSRFQVLWAQASVTIAGLAVLASVSWLGIYTGILTTTVEEPVAQTWTIPWLRIDLPNPLAADEIVQLPMSSRVDAACFVPAAVNLFSLGFFLAGLSTLLSSLDRYRWRTIGLVVGFYIFQMIIKVVGLATDGLNWLKYCSFFVAYEPERFVHVAIRQPEATWSFLTLNEAGTVIDLGPMGYNAVLLGMGLAAYVVATLVFHRRDLPAPL